MKKNRHNFFVIVFSLFVFCSVADDTLGIESKSYPRPRRKGRTSWIFTAGWNAVDDNGKAFSQLFSIRKSWSLPFYPSQGSVEIIGREGVTYGATFTFNRYKPGKEINHVISSGKFLFFSFDGFAKYHINEHAQMSKQYDPYISGGLGYTLRFIAPYRNVVTLNIGFGMNYWFNAKFGMNIQSLAKWRIGQNYPNSGGNYLHHSIGFVYIIDNSYRKKRSFIKPRYKWIHEKRNVGERKR